jgi:dTDP-L-rhamnose 4-epimerase
VGDVAKVNLMALEDSGTNFEAYNVGGDKTVSVNEYANLLIRLFGKELESENKKEFRFGDTRHILSDISKIKNIGWIPSTPLDQIIRGYVCWLQKEVEMVNAYTEAEKVMKQQGVLRSTK